MTTPPPIGTCAILTNSKGEVLLGKRKSSYKAGTYGLPGGRVNPNETVEQAIIREVEEETGMNHLNFSFFTAVRETQETHDFIHFVFVAKVENQQPILREPDKCEGWKWVDPDTMKHEILPGHFVGIEMWQEKEKLKNVVI